MTAVEVERLAVALEKLASDRRRFVAMKGFDGDAHSDAADAYEHAATLLRQAEAKS